MNFSFFLARRFFQGDSSDKRRKASTPAVTVATIGVAVGLAVMILSLSVVKGFQNEVSRKMTGFASHIEVLTPYYFTSPEDAPIMVEDAFFQKVQKAPFVRQVQRVSQKMGILKTATDFNSILLKGVDEHYDTSFLQQSLVQGRLPERSSAHNKHEILLSRLQAQQLGLQVGDTVYAYFIERTIKMRRFKVVGIYETNIKQFDNFFALTSLKNVNQLNSWDEKQCSQLEIFIDDFSQVSTRINGVARVVNEEAIRMQTDLLTLAVSDDPRLSGTFSWLQLLDFNVLIILCLMIVVAGFTMISGLLILILERTSTIGLLKALGASNLSIRKTFLYLAAFILLRGLFWGNLIAVAFIMAQRQWGWVRLDPASYYVDKVPVELNWIWVIGLNIATLLITLMALILPTLMISRIQPAKAIRFE